MPEVPFPADPECLLTWVNDHGWITFMDPEHNVRTSLPVTLGPSAGSVRWRDEGRVLVTSPSIHVPDSYPSVEDWRPGLPIWHADLEVVERLADET